MSPPPPSLVPQLLCVHLHPPSCVALCRQALEIERGNSFARGVLGQALVLLQHLHDAHRCTSRCRCRRSVLSSCLVHCTHFWLLAFWSPWPPPVLRQLKYWRCTHTSTLSCSCLQLQMWCPTWTHNWAPPPPALNSSL